MMNLTEKEFLEELRQDFILEAEEYLQTIAAGLLDLERGTRLPGSWRRSFGLPTASREPPRRYECPRFRGSARSWKAFFPP